MKKKVIFFVILIIAISLLGVYVYINKYIKTDSKIENNTLEENKEPEPEPELHIFKGTERPIAVMIDNEPGSWPHAGLQDAYMIYEIIIEGGQSRMMALFKGVDVDKIGPIRSARHYFVEYAMEHAAIYTHFGWSPKAKQTIESNAVNNINGISYDGSKFWREGTGYHTAFTSISNLKQVAKDKNYLLIGSDKPIYNYSVEEYELGNGRTIDSINMVYSSNHSVSYKYDETNKVFLRSQRGNSHTDRVTKKQYFAKNIVVLSMSNYALNDGTNKGRQEVVNEGTGTGYYLTNGKCIDITWKKDNIKSKTYLYDLNGEEIILNDGITFMQIVPKGQKIDIKYKEIEQTNDSSIN